MTTQTPPATATVQSLVGHEDVSINKSVSDYVARVRGGDLGPLPALLGLVVLIGIFTALKGDVFFTAYNFANLITQGSAVIVIAMGLIFVLLLGEIDLSAGFTSGVSAAALGVLMTSKGYPWPVAVVACLATGALVGLLIGVLVARLGIPSFVVTLAFFLALQGLLLLIIGDGGTIRINDEFILSLNTGNLSVLNSWIFAAIVVGGFVAATFTRHLGRRRAGLPSLSRELLILRIGVVAVFVGAVTYFFTLERRLTPTSPSIQGIPIVVPIIVVLLVVLTYLLGRTAWGRHVYAVGGNAEAARRAGIKVPSLRIQCFIMCSTLAAVGGILLASRLGSVSPTSGGSSTLLYAVGAAVIGGTSLFGGKGKIRDAILGGLVIAVIDNGLPLITQVSGIQFIVTGLVLLVAASVDAISRRRAMSSGRA